MIRVYTRPKGGAGLLDNRIGQPMWTKPGTPMRRALKGTIAYMRAEKPAHTNNREAGRRLTKPGTLERRWNMRDYYNQAAHGFNYGPGVDAGKFIPYTS